MKPFPRRQSYRDSITNVIRRDLMSGKFKCDEPMREQKLATRFGTSRGPVRDALMQLTQEGVLEYQPNKGVRVSSLLTDEERDVVVAMRLELEKYCMKNSFPSHWKKILKIFRFCLSGSKMHVRWPLCPKSPKATWPFTVIGSLRHPPSGKYMVGA